MAVHIAKAVTFSLAEKASEFIAPISRKKKTPSRVSFFGAADEARTRYLHLGKVALYQMSYSRISHNAGYYSKCPVRCQDINRKNLEYSTVGNRPPRVFPALADDMGCV